MISYRQLRSEAAFPIDAELCKKFGRMTARSAMHRPVQAGLMDRLPGRGSSVAHTPIVRRLEYLRGFSGERRKLGADRSSRLLDSGHRVDAEPAALRLPTGSPVVIIDRMRYADGTPTAREPAVLTERCAGDLDLDLGNTSLHTSSTSLGVILSTSSVTAMLATKADAEHLKVPKNPVTLIEQRLIGDRNRVPTESTTSRYVPARYRLMVQFTVQAHCQRHAPSRTATRDT